MPSGMFQACCSRGCSEDVESESIGRVKAQLTEPPYSAALPPLRSRRHSAVTRLISAPNLNLRNFAGPTEVRYERMSERDEIARERGNGWDGIEAALKRTGRLGGQVRP